MSKLRNNIAMHCGVNAAIVAEYLWYLLMNEASGEDAFYKYGCYWCRCSMLMVTGEFPFLTVDMTRNAIKVLSEKNIIRKGCYNDNKFDHTNWYTFTDYGVKMMEAGWV